MMITNVELVKRVQYLRTLDETVMTLSVYINLID